jgi:hypothetical protein
MDQLKSLNLALATAARILDDSAQNIRDSGLEPVEDNVRRIGSALVEILEVQQAIYAARPELKPDWLAADVRSADNLALTNAFVSAMELEELQDIDGALRVFADFIRDSDSAMHKEVAASEMERLGQQRRT